MDIKRNLTLLTDFYEITMGNSFFTNGKKDVIGYFDLFFRDNPDNGGYAIMAGVQQVIEYLENLKFDDEDIEYLRKKNMFNEEFLEYLRNFKFSCSVWAVEEGTPIFPYEPILVVKGPMIQAQLIETMLLVTINHQSLIATKASRIVQASQGRAVMEFGARRAQGYDAAIYGARAAFIAGCVGTSCTIADELFDIPALGTMGHSFIQLFDSELEAFRAYARTYPDKCVLLVDTYNVLKSGVPNAIKVFKEEVVPRGYRPVGIRIDSGDIAYLSAEARKMLDEAGFPDCKIVASNSLDEYIIRDLISQGAQIDQFGVGERLITAKSSPVFGGVYKLAAIEENGTIVPKIKISENIAKITNPGFKQVYRFYDESTNKALADVIALHDEVIPENGPYEIFDPISPWKRKTLTNYKVRKLLVPIFIDGKCVYKSPTLKELQARCKFELSTLWDSVLRFENPHQYYVDLSKPLWDLKNEMIYTHSLK